MTLSNAPRAHASWVSHWLGLDHHTSAPTPTPTPVVQPVYVQPVYVQQPVTVIVTPVPAPSIIPVAAVVYSPTPSHYNNSITLPVTGPETGVVESGLISALALGLLAYWRLRNRFLNAIKTINIL